MNIRDWTGERLETFVENETAVEHLHRYAIVLSFVKNKRVLDIACGEGYGSNLIADIAMEVVGVDIAPDVIRRATRKYKQNNLTYKVGSASNIPCNNSYFDVVVSYETIEHHDQHLKMMSELKRVLKPDGVLIISSPDKLNYTDKRNFHNPYHIKELYKESFKELINEHFLAAKFYLQRATFASCLIPENEVTSFTEFTGDYQTVTQHDSFSAMYILAICSDDKLPDLSLTLFTDDTLMSRLHSSTVNTVHNTSSYRIGHILLWPFKVLKKIAKTT